MSSDDSPFAVYIGTALLFVAAVLTFAYLAWIILVNFLPILRIQSTLSGG